MGILADQIRRKANKEAARQRCRDYAANYLAAHSCSDCGESDPVVLTFDYVRDTKRANTTMCIQHTEKLIFKKYSANVPFHNLLSSGE